MADLSLDQFQKDLSVCDNGIGLMSRRALAKICGVNATSVSRLIKSLCEPVASSTPKSLKPFVGQDFDGVAFLPDILCAAVLEYYALDAGKRCTEEARDWYRVIATYGLRQLIQKAVGWAEPRIKRLTAQEIVELCVLPVPTEWQRRFPPEYYEQLERLTGLKVDGCARPQLFGQLTKELVYDKLPQGIYQAVKQCKEETGSWDKLHQFLSEDGLRILENHQRQLLTLMNAASSLNDLRRLLEATVTKQHQLLLF